jgi:leader peptidase (prepilin peptidase)/N-methyltransferase
MVSLLWFVIGAIFGSAGNAILDRLPHNISWFSGRSRCDHCKHELQLLDLLPLLSYLMLRGKCRYCHQKIAVRNFVFELVIALGFAFFARVDFAALWWITLLISFMDWETQLVSDWLVLLWGVIVFLSLGHVTGLNLIGAAVGAGVIAALWAATRGRGMGSGDIEIAAVMGLWLGWPLIGSGLIAAFIIGGIWGVILLLTKQATMKTKLAFGPFLIAGAWMVLLLYGGK